MSEENKGPYHGVIVCCLILILGPILLTLFLKHFINIWEHKPSEINHLTAIVLGYGVGCLMDISYILLGFMNKPFQAVKIRIKELIEDLKISKKLALKGYIFNIKEEGIVFWIYLIIMIITFWITIKTCIKLYLILS